MVYLALSHEMGWDLSNYTIRHVSPINEFPNKLYRADIFVYPPLFPLLLKIGWKLGYPIQTGLFWNTAIHLVLLVLVFFTGKRLALDEAGSRLCSFYVLCCPILGFASTRLLLDILFTTGLAATLYFLITATVTGSVRHLWLASLAFSAVLNTKFQGLLFLPLFALSWIYSARVISTRQSNREKDLAVAFWIAAAVLVLIGLPHYFRLYFAYGLEGVLDLIYTIERPVGPFVQRSLNRSHGQMAVYLMILQPWILAFIPLLWGKEIFLKFRNRPELRLLAGHAIYAALVIFATAFQQERYWAPLFPILFLLLCSLLQFHPATSGRRAHTVAWMRACLVLLCLNNFMTNVITPGAVTAIVRPVLMEFLPFLDAPGGPFSGF